MKILVFGDNHGDLLSLSIAKEKAKDAEINNELYSEEILGVKYAIQKNKNNSETNIDLEMLFNAVINNPEKINNEF